MTDSSSIPISHPYAIKLVTEMMATPGKSCEEAMVAAYIERRLLEAGIPEKSIQFDTANRRSPFGGNIGNLIVKLPGTMKAPRRLLMAHIDTVPLCLGCRPVRKGDRIFSSDPKTALGGDDRAGAAVILHTLLTLQQQKIKHPPLTFLFAVQEEIGLMGIRFLTKSKLGNPRLCFNWDGGNPHGITIGATGDYSIEIEIEGIASHAGVYPEQGVSAIAIASQAIAQLQEEGWHGLVVKGKKSGSSNIGVIQGGSATNVVTPHVRIRAEARSHDAVFRKQIVNEMEKAFKKAVRSVKNDEGKTGTLHFTSDLKYESFVLKKSEPVVKVAKKAIEDSGGEASYIVGNGGLDANWMVAHGFPTVTLGCGQEAIHTVNETLYLPDYFKACEIALLLATGNE